MGTTSIRKLTLTAAIAATMTLAWLVPANAQSYYDYDTRTGDQLAGFVVGALVGAALADNHNHRTRQPHYNPYMRPQPPRPVYTYQYTYQYAPQGQHYRSSRVPHRDPYRHVREHDRRDYRHDRRY